MDLPNLIYSVLEHSNLLQATRTLAVRFCRLMNGLSTHCFYPKPWKTKWIIDVVNSRIGKSSSLWTKKRNHEIHSGAGTQRKSNGHRKFVKHRIDYLQYAELIFESFIHDRTVSIFSQGVQVIGTCFGSEWSSKPSITLTRILLAVNALCMNLQNSSVWNIITRGRCPFPADCRFHCMQKSNSC